MNLPIALLAIMLIMSTAYSSEIYILGDSITDGSKVRALVVIDGAPVIFFFKDGANGFVAGAKEIGTYGFTINLENKDIPTIRYFPGKGDVTFTDGKIAFPFKEKIKSISWSNGGTGVGPWPYHFAFRILDPRLIPRSTQEVIEFYSDNKTLELTKSGFIGDNKK